MKKTIIAVSIAALFITSAFGESVARTVTGNTMTNVFSGPGNINSIALTAPTAGAVTVQGIDNITNRTFRINAAYTNRISWLTNYAEIYTNYYNVITTNSWTNVLQSATNNAVAATTNTIGPTFSVTAAGSSSVLWNDINYSVMYGLWVTNTSPSNAVITIDFTK